MGVDATARDASGMAETLQLLQTAFPEAVEEVSCSGGDATAVVRRESLTPVIEFLRNDSRLKFDVLIDVTAVDRLGQNPRFEVIYNLLSLAYNRRLRVKLRAGSDDAVESLTRYWGSADWLEREVWDMFGIRFTGHPNLKRILLYEQFEGHPLRKDYPLRKRQPLIGPKN